MHRGKRIGAALTTGLLTATLVSPALAMDEMVKSSANTIFAVEETAIRVSSVKGNALKPGDRSLLMIGPYRDNYTAKSNAPEIVDAEQIMGFWVAAAKAEGKATITGMNKTGASTSIEITVGTGVPAQPLQVTEEPSEQVSDLDVNMEIRREMIRLINEARRENGVAELTVSDALMDAAQDISTRRPTGHDAEYESKAAIRCGYAHGVMCNLTRFNGRENLRNIAEHAVGNWRKSHYHDLALLDSDADHIGVGVTVYNGTAYCVMLAGDDQAINAYE